MQNAKKKLLAGGVAASFAVSGMVAGMAAAAPAPANAPTHVNLAAAPSANESITAQDGFVHADASMGTFGFDQGSATPNPQIATTFRGATAALLCGRPSRGHLLRDQRRGFERIGGRQQPALAHRHLGELLRPRHC